MSDQHKIELQSLSVNSEIKTLEREKPKRACLSCGILKEFLDNLIMNECKVRSKDKLVKNCLGKLYGCCGIKDEARFKKYVDECYSSYREYLTSNFEYSAKGLQECLLLGQNLNWISSDKFDMVEFLESCDEDSD